LQVAVAVVRELRDALERIQDLKRLIRRAVFNPNALAKRSMIHRRTVTYTYDAASRQRTMTVSGQPTITYDYDDANRLTSITRGTLTVTIGYDAANRRANLSLPNGLEVTYGYDAASRITSLTYAVGGTGLGTLTYAYDAAGRRTEVGGSLARTRLPSAWARRSESRPNAARKVDHLRA
jgi:YD repeat-containing protein